MRHSRKGRNMNEELQISIIMDVISTVGYTNFIKNFGYSKQYMSGMLKPEGDRDKRTFKLQYFIDAIDKIDLEALIVKKRDALTKDYVKNTGICNNLLTKYTLLKEMR